MGQAIDQACAAAFKIAERGLTRLERVPVIYRGRIIGHRTRLNEKLACAALRHMLREDAQEGRRPSHFEQRWAQIRRRDMAAPKPAPAPPAPPSPRPETCAPAPRPEAPKDRAVPRVRWL